MKREFKTANPGLTIFTLVYAMAQVFLYAAVVYNLEQFISILGAITIYFAGLQLLHYMGVAGIGFVMGFARVEVEEE